MVDYLICYFSHFTHWRDICELLIIAIIVFRCTTWLARDKTGILIKKFYLYYFFIFIVYLLELPTILYLSLMGMPFFIFSLILFHHETLAHCFINYKTAPVMVSNKENWLDELIHYCFLNFYKKKSFFIIAQQEDDLSLFITQELIIHAPITVELLALLRSADAFQENSITIINSNGLIQSINSSWNSMIQMPANQFSEQSNQEAIWCTKKTDAWYISYIPQYACLQLIIGGKSISIESADQLKKKIQEYHASYLSIKTSKGKKNEIHPNTHF